MSNVAYQRRRRLRAAGAWTVVAISLAACGVDQSEEAGGAGPATSSMSATEAAGVHWAYEGEGAPANWGGLNPDYATCSAGREQSPIDLVSADLLDLPDPAFDYAPSSWSITNNGHTLQLTPDKQHSMQLDGGTDTLLQMHLHTPSEHLVDGERFDAEAHFVHSDSDGELTVVGQLFEEGEANPAIAQMLEQAPAIVDDVVHVDKTIDLSLLLPAAREYSTYSGSLTTPPCSEDVMWIVYTPPISASKKQIADLTALMGTNSRPVQERNDRDIKEDSTIG